MRCLSQWFDVVVIDRACDYGEVCDTYQPDLALFESGVYAGAADRKITNVFANPQIPKIGFCNADPFCFSRSIFFSDMERWGVDTFFGLSLAMAEYTPEIADDLFVWPNFVDAELYRDYGESKVIPVCIAGSQAPLYPWRNRVNRVLAQHYPCMTLPHFGWGSERATARMVHGEPYARMLNASWMAPACGTIANELVRKHLEIPGSKACLITERTPAVEAAGFADMTNCVFADSADAVDKVDVLFRDPDRLQSVIEAGYRLVHTRHTMKQRSQLFQWFTLQQRIGPNETVVQPGPFDDLVVVDRARGLKNGFVTRDGLDRVLLRQGDAHLCARRYRDAAGLYRRCLNYYPMSEPKLRLAIANLYMGRADEALQWTIEPLSYTIGRSKAIDPDPVEWAYFIVALLCQGRLADAQRRARECPWLNHEELERARVAVAMLTGADVPRAGDHPRRYSVHRLPERSQSEWLAELGAMLKACGQGNVAAMLRQAAQPERSAAELHPRRADSWAVVAAENRSVEERDRALPLEAPSPRRHWQGRATSAVKIAVRDVLQQIERLSGVPLPYRISIARKNELCRAIEEVGREDVVTRALLVGASTSARVTDALLAGIDANASRPALWCVNTETAGFVRLRTRYARDTSKHFVALSKGALAGVDAASFDVVVIDGSECADEVDYRAFGRAAVIVLDDTSVWTNHRNHAALVEDANFALVAHGPAHDAGYAIFRRIERAEAVESSSWNMTRALQRAARIE